MDKSTLFEKFESNCCADRLLFYNVWYQWIRNILLNNQDINGKYYGDSLLIFFTWFDEELALDLLNCQDPNLDLNIQNKCGKTSLHYAVDENCIEVVKALLNYK